MNKDLKMKIAFTLAEGATHVGIFHNIGGTLHKFVESFTHVGIFHNIGGTLHRFVESFTHVGIFHITRRVAFTLAEVLITLGIIGIVSAMTIPTLINNYKEKVRDNQFKKVYATLNQAIKLVQSDFNYPLKCSYSSLYGGAQFSDCDVFWRSMEEKMKIVKLCPNKAFENGCVPDFKGYDNLFKETHKNDADYDEEYWQNYANSNHYGFTNSAIKNANRAMVLADNTIIILYYYSRNINQGHPLFMTDINGMSGPNKLGHDIFTFILLRNSNGQFVLTGYPHLTENKGISAENLVKKLFGHK